MPRLVGLAGLFSVLAPLSACATAPGFDVAVTVDDLPRHGGLPEGVTRTDIAKAHIDAFAGHDVDEAFGFVNARLIRSDEDETVLDMWVAAGHPLGNHTKSHLNLDRARSTEEWIADLEAGEAPVAARMKGSGRRYLRFPNLAAGKDRVRHDRIAQYLAEHNYRIASVTFAFNDWTFNRAYLRCIAAGENATIDMLEREYLSLVDATVTRALVTSDRVYGRSIPQVMLIHLNAWSARMAPATLTLLERRGARFVALRDVIDDPAYGEAELLVGGGSIIDRTAQARGIDLSDLDPDYSGYDPEVVCR